MSTIRGPVVSKRLEVNKDDIRTVSIAADGIGVWNAAFDITPAFLITGIVTEKGVIVKQDGKTEYNLSNIKTNFLDFIIVISRHSPLTMLSVRKLI